MCALATWLNIDLGSFSLPWIHTVLCPWIFLIATPENLFYHLQLLFYAVYLFNSIFNIQTTHLGMIFKILIIVC